MSSIQISNRLLSILPFGKVVANTCKPDITHIRWFHSSFILFNEQSSIGKYGMNREKAKQMLNPMVRSNPSLATASSINQTISVRQSLWERIIHELKHYYNGSKLLFSETKITFSLLRQVLHGHTLTRRERKQFIRTMADLFRLVPFSVFVIVPFMEFTLPIFLKLFPNMLPSTFKHVETDEEKLKKYLQNRLEIGQYLQDTAFNSRKTCSNGTLTIQYGESTQKTRAISDIMKFSSISADNLTLDNLNRPQLIALCKLLNLSFIGPNHYLRFKLHFKFHRLKIDDKLIVNEGIQNLNLEELQAACHDRGMKSFGVSIECLQSHLQQWLHLHLNKSIPITILIFSHALHLAENITNAVEDVTLTINKEEEKHKSSDQCAHSKVPAEVQLLYDDFRKYREDLNYDQTFAVMKQFRHLTDIQSAKVHPKYIVYLHQTSDKRHEISL